MTNGAGTGLRLAIVGGGVAGLAAAISGCEAGATVVCLEAERFGNASASSAGPGKIFRLAYSNFSFAELMMDAEARWRAYEQQTNETLIHLCRSLNIAPADSSRIQGIIRSLTRLNKSFDILTPDDPRLALWGVRVAAHEIVVLEHGGGVFLPMEVLSSLVRRAASLGAELKEQMRVIALERADSTLLLHTTSGVLYADRIIVAAGAWLPELVPEVAPLVSVSRQYLSVVQTHDPIADGGVASWADIDDDEPYGVINLPGNTHFVGSHVNGDDVQPGSPVDSKIVDRVGARHLEILSDRWRFSSQSQLVETRTCHYTNTAGREFLIAPSGVFPHTVILSACSGHGFKFALTTGSKAVALALRGTTG